MFRTYKAIIKDNFVEWESDVNGQINPDSAVHVFITVLDDTVPPDDIVHRGKCMISALNQLVKIHAFEDIADPALWEREIRQERQLPGRHNAD